MTIKHVTERKKTLLKTIMKIFTKLRWTRSKTMKRMKTSHGKSLTAGHKEAELSDVVFMFKDRHVLPP